MLTTDERSIEPANRQFYWLLEFIYIATHDSCLHCLVTQGQSLNHGAILRA